MVVPTFTESLCGLRHCGGQGGRRHGEGPRGTAAAGPSLSAGTGVRAAPVPRERRRGVAPLASDACRPCRLLNVGPVPSAGPGRPRSRPFSWVTGLLSPAVRSLPGARSHDARQIRTPHRSSEPRVVLSGPPLADTDIGTNEAARPPVTRRTGEKAPELRYDPGPVPAPGRVTRARGTAPASSSPASCPACRAPAGSGRAPPSRARGSPGARRR